MRTNYTETYSATYNILFADAMKALFDANKLTEAELAYYNEAVANGQVPRFTSLESYFTHIGDLAELHAANVANKTDVREMDTFSKFLMLPMEEIYGSDLVAIDANSRTIKIPASFAKNGVSVTGDNMAETLVFEIDRFIDVTDLTTTEIFIQWTNPAGDEGVSRIQLVDYNLKPGKLLFAWPLTRVVTTEGTGKLTFAVRFVKLNGGKSTPQYSFNTLPVTVGIKQALRTNWGEEITEDDISVLFQQAIENGPDSDAPDAVAPVFEKNLLAEYNLDADGKATMVANAIVTDSGLLSYKWFFDPVYISGNEVTKGSSVELTASNKPRYEVTTDKTAVANKQYYEMIDGVAVPYDAVTNGIGANIYEEQTIHDVSYVDSSVTGTYYVEVKNSVSGANSKTRSSAVATIPWIQDVSFTQDLNDNEFLQIEEGSAEKPIAKTLSVNTTTIPLYDQNNNVKVYFKWEKTTTIDENGKLIDWVEVVDTDGEAISTERTLSTAEPGWYRATAYGELNKEKMYEISNECRVMVPVKAPVIDHTEDVIINLEVGDVYDLTVTAEVINDKLKSDEIVYNWYRNQRDNNGTLVTVDDKDIVKINGGVLTVKKDASDTQLFYCVVVNKLADTSAETVSATFVLI